MDYILHLYRELTRNKTHKDDLKRLVEKYESVIPKEDFSTICFLINNINDITNFTDDYVNELKDNLK